MTKELQELKKRRLAEIVGIVESFGYLNLNNNSSHFPLWNDADCCGVTTYGPSCGNSLNRVAEEDTIICVRVTSSGRIYGRTLDNSVIDIEEIPTDDIDELYDLMEGMKWLEETMLSCEKWYKEFMKNNNPE